MSEDKNNNELTILSNWWLNIDKQLLVCFFILTFFGLTMSFTIKPGGSYVDQVSFMNAFTIQSAYLLFGVIVFLALSLFCFVLRFVGLDFPGVLSLFACVL